MKKALPPRPVERVKACEVCGSDVYKVKEGGEIVWMAQCGSEHLEVQRYEEEGDSGLNGMSIKP